MQTLSELFLANFKNLPIWVKQVIAAELTNELKTKLEEFSELIDSKNLFQSMHLELTAKAKAEIIERSMNLSESYYIFLSDMLAGLSIFDSTIKNSWAFSDTAKIFCRLCELDYFEIPDFEQNTNVAVALFLAGRIRTGEFLNRIGKVSRTKIDQAIKYQQQRNEEGVHIKMASVLIKLGFISDKGLDSLLLLKDEAKRRLPIGIGFTSIKYNNPTEQNDRILSLQREIARLENENIIMRKRLKKMLKMNE